jgi:hypothetical protein
MIDVTKPLNVVWDDVRGVPLSMQGELLAGKTGPELEILFDAMWVWHRIHQRAMKAAIDETGPNDHLLLLCDGFSGLSGGVGSSIHELGSARGWTTFDWVQSWACMLRPAPTEKEKTT